MPDQSPAPDHHAARAALDRAHQAALGANGAALRRSLDEARSLLRETRPDCAGRLDQALADLDSGALMELDQILEAVRREIAD